MANTSNFFLIKCRLVRVCKGRREKEREGAGRREGSGESLEKGAGGWAKEEFAEYSSTFSFGKLVIRCGAR